MDRNHYAKDNLAYDFDRFLPREKREDNVVPLDAHPQRRAGTARSPQARPALAGRLGAFAAAALICGILCMNILLRVQITETTAQIGSVQTQLERAESENVRLSMEIEQRISFKNLEEAATALGMHKPERYQVEYITVNTDDRAEVVGGKSGVITALSGNPEE